WAIVVLYEGNSEAVDWQQEQLGKELAASDLPPAWGERGDGIFRGFLLFDSRLILRASLRPSAAAGFCLRATESGNLALKCNASGVVRCGVSVDDWTIGDVGRLLRDLLEWAKSADSNVVIERWPDEWKKSLP